MSHRTKKKKVEWIFENDDLASSNPNSVEQTMHTLNNSNNQQSSGNKVHPI